MPSRYQDIYPSPPWLDSAALARPSAAELLTLEYFEAEPGGSWAALTKLRGP